MSYGGRGTPAKHSAKRVRPKPASTARRQTTATATYTNMVQYVCRSCDRAFACWLSDEEIETDNFTPWCPDCQNGSITLIG